MYYIIFVFLVFFLLLDLFFLEKKKVLLGSVISFFILTLFAGLRIHVGYDYDNYYEMFSLIKMGEDIFVEPLFYYFIKFIQLLKLDYLSFIFLIAFLSIGLKYKFLIKYSVFPSLSILVYYSRIYLNTDFGQIRQGLALGIVLFSYPYILNRKFYKYTLIVLLAALIHAAAGLFFPIYFLANKKIKKKVILTTIFVALLIATVDLKDLLLQIFETILPAGLAFKLFYYSSTEESLGITFSVILRLLIILFTIAFYWKTIEEDEKFRVVFNIYYIGYLFYLIFNSLPQLGGRGSIYFQQFELLLLPFLYVYNKNKAVKPLFIAFLIFYSIWGVITILKSVSYQTPYYFEPYETVLKLF
ncbi:EpsG family protein [Flavobacterium sp. xlx-214]|uniref:EpsG family protein n=1 Tax=unclassified Flavobacterium TaxID=196869 RepID=UPI0013D6FC35|nr:MULTISPECIES: EpsG family protein [unclassified Flavobacterium]MBA5794007.1 EpsG family protein [Flavobacterium sp. xlx-221]QMI83176.1 EpsG family protein [Flavobacterium sp. xlx-214]